MDGHINSSWPSDAARIRCEMSSLFQAMSCRKTITSAHYGPLSIKNKLEILTETIIFIEEHGFENPSQMETMFSASSSS